MHAGKRPWLLSGILAVCLWLLVGAVSDETQRPRLLSLGPDGLVRVEGAPAGVPTHPPSEEAGSSGDASADQALPSASPGNLFGSVHDLEGKPIEDATVILQGPGSRTAHSADRGRFEFLAVQGGKARVAVSAAGHVTREEVWVEAGSWRTIVLERAGTFIVEVKNRAGEGISGAQVAWWGTPWSLAQETDAAGRVRLHPRTLGYCRVRVEKPGWHMYLSEPLRIQAGEGVHAVLLEETSPLRGTVVLDESGTPLSDATLTADALRAQGGSTWTARTDAQGRFLLPHTAGPGDEVRTYVEHPLHGGMTTVLTIPRSADGVVEVRLTEPLTLRGYVLDLNGQPVADAEVFPLAVPNPAAALRQAVRTDAEGHFELKVARPVGRTGPVPLAARHPTGGYGLARLSGRGAETIRLMGVGGVAGRLAGFDASKHAALRILATPMKPRSAILAALLEEAQSTSIDGEGRFDLLGLIPGEYLFLVRTPTGGTVHEAKVPVLAGASTALAVQLRLHGVLHGVVRDTKGRPVSGAWVVAMPEETEGPSGRGVLTDSIGHFELALPPDAHTWTVTARAPGAAPARQEHVRMNGRALSFKLVCTAPPAGEQD